MSFEEIKSTATALRCSEPSQGWLAMGTVEALYIRVAKEPAPRPVSSVQAITQYGLAGDRHASPRSPRQLLLAGVDAYRLWKLPPAALRENVLVDFPIQRLQSGDLLRVGRHAVLWVTFLCEPCSLLERRCPGTLKTIGSHRGMLARVVRGGHIEAGDPVFLCQGAAPVFSDAWQSRVLHVARAIPSGHRISYSQLAEIAGVPAAYCRAFPRVLATLPPVVASRVGSGSHEHAKQWSASTLFDSAGRLATLDALPELESLER